MMKKLNPALLRKLVYIFLTVLPAILTGNIYQTITSDQISTTARTSLNALGNTIYNGINDATNNISYSLKLLSTTHEVETYNLAGISQAINLYTYYNPRTCSNIFILDKNMKAIYGLNTNQLNNISYTDHIQQALSGSTAYYYKNDPTPFAQLAYPIFSPISPEEVTGVMVATINLDYFQHTLATVSDISSNFTAYLIDSGGLVSTSSKDDLNTNKPTNFNIDDVKYALNYSPDGTFINQNGQSVYGVYYDIPSISSTLLVTYDDEHSDQNMTDYIGYILGLLGAGTVTTSEVLRKRKNTSSTLVQADPLDPCEICKTFSSEDTDPKKQE